MFWIDWLPTVAPLFGVMSVSFAITRIRFMSWSSSSATIIERPVAVPCPSSTLPSLTEIELSGFAEGTPEAARLLPIAHDLLSAP